MKSKREKVVLDLLFEENLNEFLKRFKIYEKFINNEIKCEKCNKIMTSDNLGLVKTKNGELVFICNAPECIREIS